MSTSELELVRVFPKTELQFTIFNFCPILVNSVNFKLFFEHF